MSFTDKLKLIIDVDSNGATSGLSSLKTKMSEADGFFGKLKAGAGGLKDAFGGLGPAAAGGLAAGGITAIGGAAFDAVTKFEDLGVKVGDFKDKTGLSADESSRWVKVADDMGLSAESLEGVLGKMDKNLDPEKFKALGIAIAHAKDGTVDVNATFLNAIDRLHGMADATDRAKAGALLFGKGWQTVSELVSSGADDLRTKLDAVDKQQILSDSDIKDARDFRDTMAELHTAIQNVALAAGKALVPAFKAGAAELASLISQTQDYAEKLGPVIQLANRVVITKFVMELPVNPMAAYKEAVSHATDVINTNKMSLEQLNKTLKDNGISAKDSADILKAWHDANDAAAVSADGTSDTVDKMSMSMQAGTDDAAGLDAALSAIAQSSINDTFAATAASAQQTADGIETARHAMQDLGGTEPEVGALKETIGELADKTDEASAAADALDGELTKLFGGTMDLKEGERAYIASVEDLTKSLKDNKGSMDDNTQAGRDNKDAIDKSIGAIKDQSTAMVKQGFTTQEVTDYINGHVASLVAQSSQSAKTRAAVQDYITTLGLTPENVTTAVKLAGDDVAKQKIVDLQGQLADIPAEKATEIQALIDEGSFAEAASRLEVLVRNRTMNISIQTHGGAGYGPNGVPMAGGGRAAAGTAHLVGEKGPEIAYFGDDATVIPADKTRQIMGGGGGGGGGDTYIWNVRVVPTPREQAQAKARARRLGFAA